MLRQEKERIVEELVERLKSIDTLLVADYRGLSVGEIDELRTRMLEAGARFSVVKNTLTKRAAEEAGVKELLDLIDGPTAIAFIDPDGDPVAAAKVLSDVARTHDVLVIRGGLLQGAPVSDDQIMELAKLPPPELLRAQLAGAITGPLMTVVGLLSAPVRDIVGVIDARIRQLEEEGPADTAAPEETEQPEVTEEAASPETEQVSGEETQEVEEEASGSEDGN
jgi:large subunit ribosomal protein L10